MAHHDGDANDGTQLEGKSKYVRKRGKARCLFTKKSSGYSSASRRIYVKKGELNHHYDPCGCKSACGGKDCLCLLNRTHCEKYCGCPRSCKNRFRGCRCAKNQCRTRQCSCVAANRECDPDVCRNCFIGCGDGTCGAPPQKDKSYNCMNMKLLQKQHQKVLVGRSGVSGLGAFLQNACEKDDCIGEYRGELITHHEANKRGKIYDRLNSSYLFDLNDQYVVDAQLMGNIYGSPTILLDQIAMERIGLFAKERISAGQELFFDYGYKEEVAPPWTKDHEVSGSDKDEDYTPSSSRAKSKASYTSSRSRAKRKASGLKKDEDYTSLSSRAKRKARLQIKMRTILPIAAELKGRPHILPQEDELGRFCRLILCRPLSVFCNLSGLVVIS